MATQHFDVAVIGGQVSGLISAALLAKRGRRVLLLDHGENTAYYRRKGLRLPLVPTLVPTLDSAPAVQKVHDELGLGPDLRMSSEPLDPAFQAIMPKHRIDVRVDRAAMLAELSLEFPDLVAPLRHFFERLFQLDDEITAEGRIFTAALGGGCGEDETDDEEKPSPGPVSGGVAVRMQPPS